MEISSINRKRAELPRLSTSQPIISSQISKLIKTWWLNADYQTELWVDEKKNFFAKAIVKGQSIGVSSQQIFGTPKDAQDYLDQKLADTYVTLHRTEDGLQVHIKRRHVSRLLSLVAPIYCMLNSPQERRACICYLLHYQHYNASYTETENIRLGYQNPLVATSSWSEYFRGGFKQSCTLAENWFKQEIVPVLNQFGGFRGQLKFDSGHFRFTSHSGIPALRIFFGNEALLDSEEVEKKKLNNDSIIVIDLSVKDFQQEIKEILTNRLPNLTGLQQRNPILRFIFHAMCEFSCGKLHMQF